MIRQPETTFIGNAASIPEADLPQIADWQSIVFPGMQPEQVPLTYLGSHFAVAASASGVNQGNTTRGVNLLMREISRLQITRNTVFNHGRDKPSKLGNEFWQQYAVAPDPHVEEALRLPDYALRADRLSELYRAFAEEGVSGNLPNWGANMNDMLGGVAVIAFRQALIEPDVMSQSKMLWSHVQHLNVE